MSIKYYATEEYVDEKVGTGSGGKAKTEKLLDVTFAEPTASIRIDLEHNFHRLFLVWDGGAYDRLVNADGTAVEGQLLVLSGTTSIGWNDKKVGVLITKTGTWQCHSLEMMWTDDGEVYLGSDVRNIGNHAAAQNLTSNNGGSNSMLGTLSSGSAGKPIAGSYLCVASKTGAFFNTGTRMVMVGEYYE